MKKVMLSIILSVILLVASVSAQAKWTQYGGDYTLMWNSVVESWTGVFNLTNVNTSTTASAYYPNAYNIQPLVSPLGYNETDAGFRQYLLLPYNSYLQIYDKYFTLYDEISTNGNNVGQISITDFNLDGIRNDIVGIWNTTYFGAYTFNTTTNKFVLANYTNLAFVDNNLTTIIGVRSSGIYSYAMAKNSTNLLFLKMYSTTGSDLNVNISRITGYSGASLSYTEPLAFTNNIDANVYGTDYEFLYYDTANVIIFDGDGESPAILFSKNVTQLGAISNGILDAKMLQIDKTNQWRIAVMYRSGNNGELTLSVYRLDGSLLWSAGIYALSGSYFAEHCKMAISYDYDADLINADNEIYVSCYRMLSAIGYTHRYIIFKGKTGSALFDSVSPVSTGTQAGILELVLADMNNDGKDDFISSSATGSLGSTQSYVDIFSPVSNSSIYNKTLGIGTGEPNCIPADLTFDGKLDLICSQNAVTTLFNVGGLINTNSFINVVTYSPSATIQEGNSLSISISATDNESDAIYYAVKCSDSTTWSSYTTSSTQSCVYASAGTYNNTVAVRDLYHSTSDYLSYPIFVTAVGGTSCNNNGICESSLGETISSCSSDCQTTPDEITSVEGVSIPTKLVDTTDEEAGLFPLVYRSTVTFFSAIFIPLIVIVFGIFTSLIIITIFGILQKLVNRIG